MPFIIAQICGIITLLITVISVHFKTKKKILLSQIIANTIVAIQYFLLNAITGGVVALINAIRCVVFFLYEKKNRKPSLLFLIVFILVAIVFGIMTWQNIYSIIPILAAITFTYGLWQNNLKVTKFCVAVALAGWVIYNIPVKAYVGAIQSAIECASAAIATIRYRKE